MDDRRAKLERLREQGIDPFPHQFEGVVPISEIVPSVHLPVFWGDAELQGLDVGIFIAVGALVAYWLMLSRTTLGFRVRTVGRSPEAARYGGISVARSYFLAMAISGAFAGLAGALDILGWQFRLGSLDVQNSTVGFIGIAVALLGRNTAIGTAFAALLAASSSTAPRRAASTPRSSTRASPATSPR